MPHATRHAKVPAARERFTIDLGQKIGKVMCCVSITYYVASAEVGFGVGAALARRYLSGLGTKDNP